MGDPQVVRSTKSGGRQAASGKGRVIRWKNEVERGERGEEVSRWESGSSTTPLLS